MCSQRLIGSWGYHTLDGNLITDCWVSIKCSMSWVAKKSNRTGENCTKNDMQMLSIDKFLILSKYSYIEYKTHKVSSEYNQYSLQHTSFKSTSILLIHPKFLCIHHFKTCMVKINILLFSHITIKYLFLSNIINFFELSTKFWTIYIIFNQIYHNEIILKNFKNNKNLKTPIQKC